MKTLFFEARVIAASNQINISLGLNNIGLRSSLYSDCLRKKFPYEIQLLSEIDDQTNHLQTIKNHIFPILIGSIKNSIQNAAISDAGASSGALASNRDEDTSPAAVGEVAGTAGG